MHDRRAGKNCGKRDLFPQLCSLLLLRMVLSCGSSARHTGCPGYDLHHQKAETDIFHSTTAGADGTASRGAIRIHCLEPGLAAVQTDLVGLHRKCFRACELDLTLIAQARWWLAYGEDDRLVGFAGLSPHPDDVRAGYLCRAGVDTQARGQGLHRRLIRVRLAFARKAGFTSAVTDTLRNPTCEDNLVACGFEPFMPRRPWGLARALYWRCNLVD